MSITIHTEPLAYTEFRDFIISSANWFVPSLLQMPNLDEWILKMYHNGSMYYTISGSNIISLIVGYYNREERFLYIPLNSATLLKVSERCAPKPPRMRFF